MFAFRASKKGDSMLNTIKIKGSFVGKFKSGNIDIRRMGDRS